LSDTTTTSAPGAAPSPVPPIDPRIRARRIEVRRGAGRRRLQRLADAGVVALVALGFVGALWTPLLDVDAVRVSGAEHTGADVVAERAGVEVGAPLIGVHPSAVGARVAALPWVAEVRVTRGIDGHVDLEVSERTPVATVGIGASAALVDADGRVLGPLAEAPEGPFVQLTGLGSPPAAGAYLDGAAADALALAAHITAATPGVLASLEVGTLTGTLVQGGAVRFGDARQLDAKARSLRTVLEQVDLTCLDVLDLRLPGSPVLTREEGCS
jgi:cell division protein FtsQ